MKKVAIVTINYNTDAETHALLESLKKVQRLNFPADRPIRRDWYV